MTHSSETKFTPGPWFTKPDLSDDDGASGIWIDTGEQNVAIVPGYIDHPRNIADAALIAAAPDLYEALTRITPEFVALLKHAEISAAIGEYSDNDREIIYACNVALSKARGEQNT